MNSILKSNNSFPIFIFALFLSLSSFSQSKFTIYFETNSFKLTESEQLKLDQFLRNKAIEITNVIGYCDYRSTNSYNYKLSVNRAKFIKEYIESNSYNKNIILEAKGENFEKNKDLALNRKVEIIFKEIDLIAQIKKLKKGDKLIIKNLNFYNNSGRVLPESKLVLEQLLDIMKSIPKLKIEIQGHICCQTLDESEKTEDIALVRATAVYSYLLYGGIEANRLSCKSFKSTKPIFPIPEKNEDERNANRRVEIMIVEN
jgi:outer membrane protein OmpA-like peptidoglycan-associated protein